MITLPFPPASLSGHVNGNNRWAKIKVTKEWRAKAAGEAEKLNLPPFADGDIHVHVSFYRPDRRGDRVNFPNRCKPIFDGIADALGVNDSRFVPHYYYIDPPQKPGRVEIRIGQ